MNAMRSEWYAWRALAYARNPCMHRWLSLVLAGLLVLAANPLRADKAIYPAPGPAATCPVCGMFVAKYPEWIATVVYRDGDAHHFDGAKDLFKYLLDLPHWAPGHAATEIQAIVVTEYYDLRRIDAHAAWFVVGSDVLGPMGHELIPLASATDAGEFQRDHGGVRILRFAEVDQALLEQLDVGNW